jgi:hypothetical protein
VAIVELSGRCDRGRYFRGRQLWRKVERYLELPEPGEFSVDVTFVDAHRGRASARRAQVAGRSTGKVATRNRMIVVLLTKVVGEPVRGPPCSAEVLHRISGRTPGVRG